MSPERAAKVLKFFAKEPASMSLSIVGRLLSYDEAALRAEAIKLWLRISREDDDAALSRIFDDDHPSCARSCAERCGRRLAGLFGITPKASA